MSPATFSRGEGVSFREMEKYLKDIIDSIVVEFDYPTVFLFDI